MNKEKLKEYLGFKSRIFPEKGASQECYDTRMLYEINEYLENASDNTFDKVYEYMDKKLKIAIEALETIANEVEIDTDTYRQYIDTIVGNRIKAKQALAKINKPPTAEQYFNQFKHEGGEDCIMPKSRKEIEGVGG